MRFKLILRLSTHFYPLQPTAARIYGRGITIAVLWLLYVRQNYIYGGIPPARADAATLLTGRTGGGSFGFYSGGFQHVYLPTSQYTSFQQALTSVMLRINRVRAMWKTCDCLWTAIHVKMVGSKQQKCVPHFAVLTKPPS